ncbi:hypothetical protein [Comamonas sp. MYb396]|uniref:hypothetical protein n=1 Tax=Comamonas sp. MYb396 TaxID=2745302 RepID=UPI0030ACD7F0
MIWTISLYALAIVGILYLAVRIIYPLTWLAMYATGHLIFIIRTASPEWHAKPFWHKVKVSIKFWFRQIGEAASWPATQVTCGPYKWVPLFNYSGFKPDQAKKED